MPDWTPANTLTALWLDAADSATVTESGGTVTDWADKSGQGNNVTQATVSRQPTYNAAANGGLGEVEWTTTGANGTELYGTMDNAVANGDSIRAFVLRSIDQSSSTTYGLIMQLVNNAPSNAGDALRAYYKDTSNSLDHKIGSVILQDTQNPWVAANDTAPQILVSVRDTANTTIQLWLNGEMVAESTSVPALNAADESSTFYIGSGTGTSQDSFGGAFEEIVIATDATADTRERLEGYLAWRRGLVDNLPVGHPYKSEAPQTAPAQTITGSGALSFQAAQVSGSGILGALIVGSGALQLGPAQVSGSAAIIITQGELLRANWDGTSGETSYNSEIGADAVFVGDTALTDTETIFDSTTVRLPGSVADSYLKWGVGPELKFLHDLTTNYTLEFWLNPEFVDLASERLLDTVASVGSAGVALRASSNDLIYSIYSPGGTVCTAYITFNKLAYNGAFHYFKIVYTATTDQITIYVGAEGDAQSTLVRTASCSAPSGDLETNGPLYIGRRQDTVGQYVRGYLGPIQITKGTALDDTTMPEGPFGFVPEVEGLILAPSLLRAKPVYLLGFQDVSESIREAGQRYILEISGDPVLRIPISTWQATVQDAEANYIQCSIPSAEVYVDELAARAGVETFTIYGASLVDGREYKTALASAPLGAADLYRGSYNYTGVLRGYTDPVAPTAGNRTALNVRTVSVSGGNLIRVRCDIDWFLRPGNTLEVPGYSFVVNYINYYCPAGQDNYMDVGERG